MSPNAGGLSARATRCIGPWLLAAFALIGATLSMSGCAGPASQTSPAPEASPSPESEVMGTPLPGATSLAPGEIAPGPQNPSGADQSPYDHALRILMQSSGLRADQITLVDAIRVEWPDGSLGCPQPGLDYVQMLTPGYLVTLVAEGAEYRIHLDDTGAGVVCFSGEGVVGSGPDFDPIAEEFIQQARFDLAQRLNVALEDIEFVSSEPVEWPDGRLGCADSGEAAVQMLTAGYRIVLSHAGQQYFFHTSYDQMIACENPLP